MNVSTVESQEDFNARCRASAFLGTLQATYTDFHYLRDEWRVATEKDALLGISMTGIASRWFLNNVDTEDGAREVLAENERLAKILKINKASRTCLVKPDGTSSILLGSSSGIHSWYAPYYIRRVRVGKDESIYTYFKINNPDMLEDDLMTKDTAIIKFPIKAPDGAITRNESAFDLLERIKKVYNQWIIPGHRKGSNTHNTSVTVSVKPDEWNSIGDWMWENKDHYNGISVLPYDSGSYTQAPFEEITKEEYERLLPMVHEIDLSGVFEKQDNTNHQGEVACGGGGCELK
jgi:ribonucleoside-diphosphate reductase alpha chain